MGRLADPNIPGTDKVGLVQYGTPADAAALDRFGKALHDSGYAPLTFEATDLNVGGRPTGQRHRQRDRHHRQQAAGKDCSSRWSSARSRTRGS